MSTRIKTGWGSVGAIISPVGSFAAIQIPAGLVRRVTHISASHNEQIVHTAAVREGSIFRVTMVAGPQIAQSGDAPFAGAIGGGGYDADQPTFPEDAGFKVLLDHFVWWLHQPFQIDFTYPPIIEAGDWLTALVSMVNDMSTPAELDDTTARISLFGYEEGEDGPTVASQYKLR